MEILITWITHALLILAVAYILPGVTVSGFISALAVALVLGILNTVIKPILILLTLPVNILTLGLFTLVINALLIMLAAAFVPGFKIGGFVSALIFGVVLSLATLFLHLIFRV